MVLLVLRDLPVNGLPQGHPFERHCDHCLGAPAKCSCTQSCPIPSKSSCQGTHAVACAGCSKESIVGARTICGLCPNTSLCHKCVSMHDASHPTLVFNRPTSTPIRRPGKRRADPGNNLADGDNIITEKSFFIPPSVSPNNEKHSWTCDVCTHTITGLKFTCTVCSDYTLCEVCYRTGMHFADHRFNVELSGTFSSIPGRLKPRGEHDYTSPDHVPDLGQPEKGHCEHCPGWDTACICTSKCGKPSGTRCKPFHNSGLECTHCGLNHLTGTLYRCGTCTNTAICEECYTAGKHDRTHPMVAIEDPDSEGVALAPRALGGKPLPSPTQSLTGRTTYKFNDCAVCLRSSMSNIFLSCETCAVKLCSTCYHVGMHAYDPSHTFTFEDMPAPPREFGPGFIAGKTIVHRSVKEDVIDVSHQTEHAREDCNAVDVNFKESQNGRAQENRNSDNDDENVEEVANASDTDVDLDNQSNLDSNRTWNNDADVNVNVNLGTDSDLYEALGAVEVNDDSDDDGDEISKSNGSATTTMTSDASAQAVMMSKLKDSLITKSDPQVAVTELFEQMKATLAANPETFTNGSNLVDITRKTDSSVVDTQQLPKEFGATQTSNDNNKDGKTPYASPHSASAPPVGEADVQGHDVLTTTPQSQNIDSVTNNINPESQQSQFQNKSAWTRTSSLQSSPQTPSGGPLTTEIQYPPPVQPPSSDVTQQQHQTSHMHHQQASMSGVNNQSDIGQYPYRNNNNDVTQGSSVLHSSQHLTNGHQQTQPMQNGAESLTAFDRVQMQQGTLSQSQADQQQTVVQGFERVQMQGSSETSQMQQQQNDKPLTAFERIQASVTQNGGSQYQDKQNAGQTNNGYGGMGMLHHGEHGNGNNNHGSSQNFPTGQVPPQGQGQGMGFNSGNGRYGMGQYGQQRPSSYEDGTGMQQMPSQTTSMQQHQKGGNQGGHPAAEYGNQQGQPPRYGNSPQMHSQSMSSPDGSMYPSYGNGSHHSMTPPPQAQPFMQGSGQQQHHNNGSMGGYEKQGEYQNQGAMGQQQSWNHQNMGMPGGGMASSNAAAGNANEAKWNPNNNNNNNSNNMHTYDQQFQQAQNQFYGAMPPAGGKLSAANMQQAMGALQNAFSAMMKKK